MADEPTPDDVWRLLLGGHFGWDADRRRFRLIPGKHRCKNCNAPLDGVGAVVARILGRRKFDRNPRFCNF